MDEPTARRDEWLVEPLAEDVRLALDRLGRAPDVERIVVLPDVHLAREVCIGTVVATSASLYPAAVGGDIGCGMAAVGFDAEAEVLDDARSAARVLTGLGASVPILRHPRSPVALPEELLTTPLSDPSLERARHRDAPWQLGTLGRGNHFVELQADGDGRLWVMVHSGSRSLGQRIRDFHENRGERVRGGLRRIEADSAAGRAYLQDVGWALAFAAANRAAILAAVTAVVERELGARPIEASAISCHHNFVRRENHGRELWVHRKGAISAGPGEPGILPGSMGTASCHVRGRGDVRSLCSSSHGAGRRLARGEARRRIRVRDVERQLAGVWYDHRLTARLRDEAPGAYKDLDQVLRAQRDLTRCVRRLRPLLSFKGA